MPQLHDIAEVCARLGTTSRTLRYYESEGLIESTVAYPSHRRHYTEAQLDTIKQVLALRTLGLSVNAIRELNRGETSLSDAILAHRADMIRLIVEKQQEINLLEDVLHGIQGGATVVERQDVSITCTDRQEEIANLCTDAILCGDFAALTPYYSTDMKILFSAEALAHSWAMTVAPVGALMEKQALFRLPQAPNVVLIPLRYERMTVRLKYVFHGEEICGFWSDYVSNERKNTL